MSSDISEPITDTFESLQTRHRKEQRDLVSRITQKKKQASKKTRKGVNDECERLERELKERQERELAALNGQAVEDETAAPSDDGDTTGDEYDVANSVANLKINGNGTPTSTPPSTTPSSTFSQTKSKKPNRAKARLARRAADQAAAIQQAEQEAAHAPNPRELERERMATQLEAHKLALHEIRADGHCLYAAVADQLVTRELGLKPKIEVTIAEEVPSYKKVRHTAATFIETNDDYFVPFLEDPLPEHVHKIRETGEWGGHVELLALARSYGVRICVLHSDGRVDRIEGEEEGEDTKEIWLGYYRHSHGLGEHYNSLRKIG